MVELPRHVHRVTKRQKSGEVTYIFYTRHRNTPDAWPSIKLPNPLTEDFVKAHAVCMEMERQSGKFFLFGVDLPDHKSDDFWPKAFESHAANERRKHDHAKDFTALIEAFEESDSFKTKSNSTQRGYKAYGKIAKAAWAFDLPAELTAVDAQEAIDAMDETPAAANQFRAYLSRLMSWGIPRGFCTENPVAFTEKAKGGDPRLPWPDWAFEVLIEQAPFHMLLPAISAFFTGQRQGDVLAMKRPRAGENTIEVKAAKTGTTAWIPIHSEYRKWIDRAPKGGSIQLHLGVRGLPYKTADGFRSEWGRMLRKPEFERFREMGLVFHGLRKNAVINLLEVGCTEAEAGAIANMSPQMVRHYSRDVSMRMLAQNGMKRLEERWKEVQPAAFANKNGT